MRRVVVGLSVLLAFTIQPSPTAAACGYPLAVDSAVNAPGAVVFVGTVVELENLDTWATFAVEEVWAGDVAGRSEVDVHGGPPFDEFISVGEVRRFELGARYLVVPSPQNMWEGFGDRDGVLGDNACTSTQLWNDGLARFRPADATVVERDDPILPRTNDTSPPYVMIALTTVLVAGGCLYLLLRRGSIAYRARDDEESTGRGPR